jgi:hypothetical protein
VGEVGGNLTEMLAAKGITTPFDVSADSAPAIYVHGQPGRTAPQVRAMERAAAGLSSGLDTLRASTTALVSRAPRDAGYTRIEGQLQRLGRARDTLPCGCATPCWVPRSTAAHPASRRPVRSSRPVIVCSAGPRCSAHKPGRLKPRRRLTPASQPAG